MKFIIAGGKNYYFSAEDIEKLNKLKSLISEVVSGGASGADSEGEKWAKANKIPVKVFKADWAKFGRAAGPIRNKQMADYADAVILFPGGSGTRSMHSHAVKKGLRIYDYRNISDFKEWFFLNEGFGFDWSKLPKKIGKEFIQFSGLSIDVKNAINNRSEYLFNKNKNKLALSQILNRVCSKKDFMNLIEKLAFKNSTRGNITINIIKTAANQLEQKLKNYLSDPNIANEILSIFNLKSLPKFDMVKELEKLDIDHSILYFTYEDQKHDIFRLKPLYKRQALSVAQNKYKQHGVDVTVYYAFELAPTFQAESERLRSPENILSKMSGEEIDPTGPYSYEHPEGSFTIDAQNWRKEWDKITLKIKENEKKIQSLKKQKDSNGNTFEKIEQLYKPNKKNPAVSFDYIAFIENNKNNIEDSSYNIGRYYQNFIKLCNDQNVRILGSYEFQNILYYLNNIKPDIEVLEKEIIELKKHQQNLKKSFIKPNHPNDPSKPMTLRNKRPGNINTFLRNAKKAFINIMKDPQTDNQRDVRLFFADEAAKLYKNANPDKNIDIIIYPQTSKELVGELVSAFSEQYKKAKIIEGFKKRSPEEITMDVERAISSGKSKGFIDSLKKSEEILKKSGDNKSLKGAKSAHRLYANLYYNAIPKDVEILGKDILVIDDVGTTGSTMQQIKNSLENMSPNSIEFFVPLVND